MEAHTSPKTRNGGSMTDKEKISSLRHQLRDLRKRYGELNHLHIYKSIALELYDSATNSIGVTNSVGAKWILEKFRRVMK